MRRRSALLAVLVLLLVGLSGCSYEGSLSMDPVPNATAIAEHASIDVTDLDEEPSRLVLDAVDGTGPTTEADHPPFTPDRPVAVGGTYYNVTWSEIGSKAVPEFVLTLEKNPTNTTGDPIAYQDLPAVDKRALPDRDSGLIEDDDTIATQAVYTEREQAASVLVPEPRHALVEFGDRTVRITVEGPSPKTIHTYRYEASPVADHSEELAARLEQEYLFALTDLSGSEREIVNGATGDTHYAERQTEAWTRLVRRFDAATPVYADTYDGDYLAGEYLVRYDGSTYWADISGYTDEGT